MRLLIKVCFYLLANFTQTQVGLFSQISTSIARCSTCYGVLGL